MGWAVAVTIWALMIIVIARSGRTRRRRQVESLADQLRNELTRHFLTEPCPTCHESGMELLAISPNARSIHYACRHCGKKRHAAAMTAEAASIAAQLERLQIVGTAFNTRHRSDAVETTIFFTTSSAPLPFEQTTREPISEGIRSEVWRRDLGKCVKCQSNQNLEFDHIIPVSQGGATTARNLQLLCKSCNLEKGARI